MQISVIDISQKYLIDTNLNLPQKIKMENKNLLKNFDLFTGLDETAFSELSKNSTYKILEAKDVLFNESFEGSYFYFLIKGLLRIYKTSFEGRESTIKIIYPGEMFAEAVLFGKKEYPVSVMAMEMSEVIGIHRDSFWKMLKNEESRDEFIKAIFGKLRFLTDRIHYLSSHDVEDRFFKFLIDNYGKKIKYDISMPKKDFASAIGTIPETFSRLILRLTKTGIITWDKNKLEIRKDFWDNVYFD